MLLKGIILCEGNSDQILLGHLIQKRKNWIFEKGLKNAPFKSPNIAWYKNSNKDIYGIWYVGGSNFKDALEKIFKREKLEHSLESLLIMTDNDDSNEADSRLNSIIQQISNTLSFTSEEQEDLNQRSKNAEWCDISIKNDFSESSVVHFCYLLIPNRCNGSLETFMLNSLSEKDDSRKYVSEKAHKFVENFNSESKYNIFLTRRRERVKAELGIFISVLNPDKMFDTLRELIESVDWNKFDTTKTQFSVLLDEGHFD